MKNVLAFAMIFLFLFYGCTAPQEQDGQKDGFETDKRIIDITEEGWDDSEDIRKIKQAEDLLNLIGMDSVQIQSGSPQVVAIYQPSELEYEYEMVNDWAKIFSVLSEVFVDSEYITIEQMYAGEKVFSLSSKTSDIESFSSGEISMQEFKLRLYLSPRYLSENKDAHTSDSGEVIDGQDPIDSQDTTDEFEETTKEGETKKDDKIDFWKDYKPAPEICSIKTDKETLIVGDQAQIKTWATAPPKTPISFLCSDDVIELGSGGIRTGSRFCKFEEPGIYRLWIAIGEKPCNHVDIEVTKD
jgi:hypothetical protein